MVEVVHAALKGSVKMESVLKEMITRGYRS